jgi:hypothetical protein
MKLIASTPDGFIADISRAEAMRLSGTGQPTVGDTFNPLTLLNRAQWLTRQADALEQLEENLRIARERIQQVRQTPTEETRPNG